MTVPHHIDDVNATDILRNVDWFRALMKTRDVLVRNGSEMDRALRKLEEYGRMVLALSPTQMSRTGAIALYRDALGWNFLIRAVHLAGSRLRDQFGWRELAGKDVVITRKAEQSKARDVLFELCAAAVCMTFASDVQLDEPDVTLTFDGVRRGLACKMLYSAKQSKHEKRLVEGAKQIDKAAVDRGYVFVNLANLVPHAVFFPERGPAPFRAVDDLRPRLEQWAQGFGEHLLGKQSFVDRFTKDARMGVERTKLAGLIAWFPTLADVAGRAVNVSWIQVAPRVEDHPKDRAFELAFHRAWMDVNLHRWTL